MPLKSLDLAEFLQGIPDPSDTTIPCLVHTTKGTRIYDILGAGKLSVSTCPVFKHEKLLYCFVGRPAYKLSDLSVSDFWLTPVCFVFDNPLPIAPKRIYPFDSGAFVSTRLGEEFADFRVDRFELPGDYKNLSKLISVFFGSVSKYRRAQARDRNRIAEKYGIGPNGFSILALSSLLTKRPNDEFDDRNSAIEVQFSDDIDLKVPQLKGIVLAEEWMDDPHLALAIKDIGCHVETYPIYPLSRASYSSKIYEAVEKIDKL